MMTAKEHIERRLEWNKEVLDDARIHIQRVTSGHNWTPADVIGIAVDAAKAAENIHTLQTLLGIVSRPEVAK